MATGACLQTTGKGQGLRLVFRESPFKPVTNEALRAITAQSFNRPGYVARGCGFRTLNLPKISEA